MNFTLADISNVFTDMIQSELPKSGMPDGKNLDGRNTNSRKQSFAEELNKTLERIQSVSARIDSNQVDSAMSDSVRSNSIGADSLQDKSEQVNSALERFGIKTLSSDKDIETLSEKLTSEKGMGFVAALKNIFLMLSKGDLKDISIDGQGLEALKKMLLNAGFKESDLDELISELASENEKDSLSIADIFDGLFELPLEDNLQTDVVAETFIASSALPFLESILISMGISQQEVQDILELADKGENGISLDTIIDNLKSIQKTAFYSHDHYQTNAGDKNISQMLNQLGLQAGENKSSVFTLDDFIASLEAVRKDVSSRQIETSEVSQIETKSIAGEKPLDLLNALFKGIQSDAQKAQKPLFEFSADQIKDEFKNNLVAAGADKLSLKAEISADISSKEVAKEMAALLGEKENTPADKIGSQLKETKGLLKQSQVGETKIVENSQLSTSDLKSNTAIDNLNNLKSNAQLKNLPTYVTNQVTKSLVRAINQGENTLRIQLNPPELGRLMMTIDNSGETLKVNIVTESLAAKDILTSNAGELKNVLSSAGVNLEQFDVDMDSDFKQSMADAKNQAGNFSKRRQNREKVLSDLNSKDGRNGAGFLSEGINQEGSLHFVA